MMKNQAFNMIEKLSNNSLSLERIKLRNLDHIYDAILSSRREISPWLNWLTSHYSKHDCLDFIKLQIKNWDSNLEYTYVIKNNSGVITGLIGLHIFDPQNDVASIGYWIKTEFTGQRICTEALKLLVKNAMVPLNLIRIELIVAISNKASQKVALNAGAELEASLKNRIRLNGIATDANVYCFTSPI
ncbi:MAG: GNAT family N-acetyltransferase [Marinicellaceae bacterium]